MSAAYKCDRCAALKDGQPARHVAVPAAWADQYGRRSMVGVGEPDTALVEVDLCDHCDASIRRHWIDLTAAGARP